MWWINQTVEAVNLIEVMNSKQADSRIDHQKLATNFVLSLLAKTNF